MEPTGWIKLWRKSRYDQRVRALSDSEFRLWVNLLMFASNDGRTAGQIVNEVSGEPLSIRAIAAEVGMAQTVVFRGLVRLCELGLCERRPHPFNRQGHIYRIPKFSRYQDTVNRSATGTPVPPGEQSEKPTVPQTVPESVPPGERFAEQDGVPPGERSLPLAQLPQAQMAHQKRSATGTGPSRRSREVEKTSKATSSASDDADTKRLNKEKADAIQAIWEAFGFEGNPSSDTFAKCMGRTSPVKGRVGVALDFAEYVRLGLAKPDPRSAPDDFLWSELKGRLVCPEGTGWRRELRNKRGGPAPYQQSLIGWPTRFEKGTVNQPTPEEREAMIRSPDFDRFPPLDLYMAAPVVDKIREARQEWEGRHA